MQNNPCLSCGACCAYFRASFYWAECDDAKPDGVPAEMTRDHPPYHRVMLGTSGPEPRCIALEGHIGQSVKCGIYDRRSTVCRGFVPSWEDGQHNPDCDAARARHGLPALAPEDWRSPDDDLRPAA